MQHLVTTHSDEIISQMAHHHTCECNYMIHVVNITVKLTSRVGILSCAQVNNYGM